MQQVIKCDTSGNATRHQMRYTLFHQKINLYEVQFIA